MNVDIFQKIGGRKFVVSIVAMIVGGAVDVFGPKGLSIEFMSLLVSVVGIFSGANAIVTRGTTTIGKLVGTTPPSAPEPTTEPEAPALNLPPGSIKLIEGKDIGGQLDRIETMLEAVAGSVGATNNLLLAAMKQPGNQS